MSGRSILCRCICATAACLMGLCGAGAQGTRANVPLPPPRPSSLSPPPVASPPAVDSKPPDIAPTPQPETIEPQASREHLRGCSLQWREMKKTGAAFGLIWRDFARSCLGKS